MAYCTKCGDQIDDSAAFCPKCGDKTGEASESSPETIIKSKKECIYDGFCNYLKRFPYNANASFAELEKYEEGQDGKIYAEIVATSKDMFGRTKNTRYGGVVNEVEADGHCVFQAPGAQLITPLTPTKVVKMGLKFKSAK
jgi:hypothetical protein